MAKGRGNKARKSSHKISRLIANGVAINTLALMSSSVFANGFFLPQQNVTNLGMAYAGTASLAEDASNGFYNPAGLTRIDANDQVVVGAVMVYPNTTLDVTSAASTTGVALTPSTGVRPDNKAVIPNMHYAHRVNDRWSLGASIVSTFGSKTNYPEDSIARYVATRSELLTVDLAPSVAYKFNLHFSLGLGPDILYTKAKLDKALGTGGAGTTDGILTNEGKDKSAFGYHIGGLFEFDKCNRVGLTYRSAIKTRITGTSYSEAAVLGSAASSQDITTEINLPESFTVSAYHAFNDTWAVMADAQWIRWNRVRQISLEYANGTIANFNYNYRNSYRVAVGGTYQFNDKLQFKAGTSFDKTPTNDTDRVIAIPENNQTGVGVGAKYVISKCVSVDAAYVRVFTKRASITQNAPVITPAASQTAENIRGDAHTSTDVVGLQLTWNI
jgi:long-chain fatty acid transport protein